jgi:transposase
MTITQQLQTIACGSTDPRVVRAAAEFPAKLFAVHGDKIKIRESAVYYGDGTTKGSKGKGIDVSCAVCGHEWRPRARNLINGAGCPECRRLNNINSAGARRCFRSTADERERAIYLRSQGKTFTSIAAELGRSNLAIQTWVDPAQRERVNEYSANRYHKNPSHQKAVKAAYLQTPHGAAADERHQHKRRILKQNIDPVVFIDGVAHEVDLKETWAVFSKALITDEESRAIAKLQRQKRELTKQTGIVYHLDHIHPLTKGGEHSPFNLQIITKEENLSKSDTFRMEDQIELAQRLFNIN